MGNTTTKEESTLKSQDTLINVIIKQKKKELQDLRNILEFIRLRMLYMHNKFMSLDDNVSLDSMREFGTSLRGRIPEVKKPTFEMPEVNMPSWGNDMNTGSAVSDPDPVASLMDKESGPSEPLDDVYIHQQPSTHNQPSKPTYTSNNPTYTKSDVPMIPEVQISTDPADIINVSPLGEESDDAIIGVDVGNAGVIGGVDINVVPNVVAPGVVAPDDQPSMITLVKFNALTDELDLSQSNLNKLQTQYDNTKSNYDALQSKYTSNQQKYNELQSKYDAIANVNDANAVLKMQYDTLIKTKTELELKYNDTQKEIVMLLNDKTAVNAELEKCKADKGNLSPYLPEKIITAVTDVISLTSNGVSTILGDNKGRRVSHNMIAGDQGICMFKQMPNKKHAVSCTRRCKSGYYPVMVGNGDNNLKYETMCIPGKRSLRYGDVIDCDTEFKVYNQHRGAPNAPRFKTINKDELHDNPDYRLSGYTCDDVRSMF